MVRTMFGLYLFVATSCLLSGQVNGAGQRPYLGWSSFSQQTLDGNFLTQASIWAQSDALRGSALEAHGFVYINMDSGWMGSFDANGRPIPNATTFPNIKALVDHIHANGQKAGIYWIPGIEQPAVGNFPVLGTSYLTKDIIVMPPVPGNSFSNGQNPPYHQKLDFSRPGAQEYVDSVVALFSSWGIDFIKLDGVTPGSDDDDTSIDNRADVEAWSNAIAKTGRNIWLTVSWALDKDYLSTWQAYSNARRIEDDVECEGRCGTMTNWPNVLQRFYDLVGWEDAAGISEGWNDLDSLDIGVGATGGLTEREQRSAVTLWAMANAPLFIGGDLTTIDAAGVKLLTNDEVLAIDQSQRPAHQVLGGFTPVWVSDQGDGTLYVALFNLNAFDSTVSVSPRDLGVGEIGRTWDVWERRPFRCLGLSLSTLVPGHDVRLIRVSVEGRCGRPSPSTSYEAEAATLSGTAAIASCSACSGGAKVGNLGLGPNNNVTFNNVWVRRAGIYDMEVDSATLSPRAILYRVNGGPFYTLNAGGGSFNLPSSTTVRVALRTGANSIQFGNPTSYPPDLDRIVISGDGTAPPPNSITYEGENATFTGSAGPAYCQLCSGAGKAGNIGGTGTVTFENVTVPRGGAYPVELDYETSGARTVYMTVNGGTPVELDLNGTTFDSPANTVLQVHLKAGANVIQFANANGYAPDIDRIAISLP